MVLLLTIVVFEAAVITNDTCSCVLFHLIAFGKLLLPKALCSSTEMAVCQYTFMPPAIVAFVVLVLDDQLLQLCVEILKKNCSLKAFF